jgi:hypothetical protein
MPDTHPATKLSRFAGLLVRRAAIAAGCTLMGFGLLLLPSEATAQRQQQMSFKEDVFPILKGYCMDCHSPGGEGYEKSGLDLRTHEGLMRGTKFGPMVNPGDSFASNLMVILDHRASPEIRMPFHAKKLPEDLRNIIRVWIDQGAKNN